MKTKKKKKTKIQQSLLQYAIECQKASPTRNLLSLASPHLRLNHMELDANPFLLNCKNGTLNLHRGELKSHSPSDYLTKMIDIEYDANAKCPRFEKFLFEIFDGDRDLIDFVQRALGYSITGDVSEQCFFICYGTGANGKSTLTALMTILLGDYAVVAAPGLLITKQHENHLTEIADLCGARFVPSSEVKTDAKWNEEKIKMLTGGDPISARRMREDLWRFYPSHKFWIPVNHRPITVDSTYGFWRRVKMIPFIVTISKESQDSHLLEALKSEMPGILTWLVQGCLLWQKHGLGSARAVDMATEAYRCPQNDIEGFIAHCCLKDPILRIQAQTLYKRYVKWCGEQKVKPLRQPDFGSKMKLLGWNTTKSSVNYYIGLCLNQESDEVMSSSGSEDAFKPYVDI